MFQNLQANVKIKICGIFQEADIIAMNKATPDFIGFVFYKKSSRYVDFDKAKKLKELLNPKIKVVGVFVDESPENIIKLFEAKTIDIAQLHGKEDESYVKRLKSAVDLPIIKAEHNFAKDFSEENSADYFLFDSFDPIGIGGTGKTINWSAIPKTNKPFFLAGGLNSENIIEAIEKTKPFAVDISSGVETNGQKDRKKINEIVKIVRNYKP